MAKELAGQLQVLENNAHPFYKPKFFVVRMPPFLLGINVSHSVSLCTCPPNHLFLLLQPRLVPRPSHSRSGEKASVQDCFEPTITNTPLSISHSITLSSRLGMGMTYGCKKRNNVCVRSLTSSGTSLSHARSSGDITIQLTTTEHTPFCCRRSFGMMDRRLDGCVDVWVVRGCECEC